MRRLSWSASAAKSDKIDWALPRVRRMSQTRPATRLHRMATRRKIGMRVAAAESQNLKRKIILLLQKED